MTLSNNPFENDSVKFYAGIGHVCLQWALLEMALLGLISAAEGMPMDKVMLMFGGLDMQPRCNMAINLAQYEKWPLHLVNRIKKIRTALQRDGAGLAERRNQAIHGVHGRSEIPESFQLTMVRWKGPKRTQDVSIADLYKLGLEIAAQAQEAFRIFEDYGTWKFGDHRPENSDSQIPERKPVRMVAENLKTRLHHLWRRLRG